MEEKKHFRISFNSESPYDPDEPAPARHARRRELALLHADKVQAWAESRGVDFNIIDAASHFHATVFRFRVPLNRAESKLRDTTIRGQARP